MAGDITLRAQLAALAPAVEAPTDAGVAAWVGNTEQLRELMIDANGMAVGTFIDTKIAAVSADKHLLIPDFMVEAPPAVEAQRNERIAALNARGMPGEDLGRMRFLNFRQPWKDGRAVDFTNHDQLFDISRAGMMYIFALNWAKNKNHLESLLNTVGAAAGMLNRGGDGLAKEWKSSDKIPGKEAFSAAVQYLGGKHWMGRVQLALDILSFLGYSRISDTHPVDSTNNDKLQKQATIINKCIANHFSDDLKVEGADVPRILHGSMHGLSLHGAVGLMLKWPQSRFSNPIIKIRCTPMGDLGKAAVIAHAGFISLSSHPVLYGMLSNLQPLVDDLQGEIDTFVATPWERSSLCGLFEDKLPTLFSTKAEGVCNLLASMIAAAADAALLSSSFKSAHYITHHASKAAGGVEFWRNYFASLKTRVAALKDSEIKVLLEASKAKAIKDADDKEGAQEVA